MKRNSSKVLKDIINEFFQDIDKRFLETKYYEYGITNYLFNFDERDPNLTIEISHYDKGDFIIVFNDLYSYNVSLESNYFYANKEQVEGIAFLDIIENSRYKNYIKENSLVYTNVYYVRELKVEIYHFRVSGQNFYIDVLTSTIPKLIIKG